ncbi:ECF-type sigma factor [Zavarzinella formosa]|uniref:ECF-type sigma factor n=1 Tax=Zavarzinella formosa TaxID=360055 RepID=UPI0002DE9D6B|nr:ECF-type sigma factor [Zavarzinella formosa]
MSDVTRLLEAATAGNRQAAAELLPLVYDELRRLAAARMAAEAADHTLQPTALVHEAYVRLVGPTDDARWENRGHFFAAAAEAMRRILVDAARRKHREKRGGGMAKVELLDVRTRDPDERLIALDDALEQLALTDSLAARVVELRQFAGLGHEEIAAMLGLTVYAARQKWTFARAWLRKAMTE